MNTGIINLSTLSELSASMRSAETAEAMLGVTLLSLMGKLRCRWVALLVPTDGEGYRPVASKGRFPQDAVASPEASYPIAVPLDLPGVGRALLCAGPSMTSPEYSEEEKHYVVLVAGMAGSAAELIARRTGLEAAKRLVDKEKQLVRTLFETAGEFLGVVDNNDALRLFRYRLMGQLMVRRFAVVYCSQGADCSVLVDRLESPLGAETARYLIAERPPALSDRADIPLIAHLEAPTGGKVSVALGYRNDTRPYAEDEVDFVHSLARFLLSAFENSRLFAETLRRKQLENEMALARTIQGGLLPSAMPKPPGWSLGALTISAKAVGGDYYDCIETEPGIYLMAIADVSGKGLPASLLMANIQAALRTLARDNKPLDGMISRINDLLYENTNPDKFVTAFFVLLNTATGRLVYSNAGHNPPLLVRADGTQEKLTEGGLILGILPSISPWEIGETTLRTGDTLVMFTDGVTEAMDADNKEYTDERLEELLGTIPGESHSAEIANAILADVRSFVQAAEQSDDITILVIKKET